MLEGFGGGHHGGFGGGHHGGFGGGNSKYDAFHVYVYCVIQ